jgi:hypothetical protein
MVTVFLDLILRWPRNALLLWNLNFHYRFLEIQAPDLILSHLNLIDLFTLFFFFFFFSFFFFFFFFFLYGAAAHIGPWRPLYEAP